MENKPPQYYFVRTKRYLVEKNIIGIGWNRINFSKFEHVNDLIKAIKAVGYKIPRRKPAISCFFGMKKGDIIVVPLDKSIAIGFVDANDLSYSESELDKKEDRSNQRNVDFHFRADKKFITIRRVDLSNAFQNKIRMLGGLVLNISAFEDQIDNAIESIRSGNPIKKKTWIKKDVQNTVDFSTILLKNIKNGKTYLQAGGIGLERLVNELLIAEGYKAKVLGKQKFEGFADADIEAIWPDTSNQSRFDQPKLLVQVKHHQGTTGGWGVKQLEKINIHHDRYDKYQLVLVTSAKVSLDLLEKAKTSNIRIIEGEELARWIIEHLDKLPSKMKATLGIEETLEIMPQIAG